MHYYLEEVEIVYRGIPSNVFEHKIVPTFERIER